MKTVNHSSDEQKLAQHLSQLENGLEKSTLCELSQRRDQALRSVSRSPRRPLWLLPAASAALASVLLLVVFWQPASTIKPKNTSSIHDQTEWLLPEQIELYKDLEFYSWLAESELNGSG